MNDERPLLVTKPSLRAYFTVPFYAVIILYSWSHKTPGHFSLWPYLWIYFGLDSFYNKWRYKLTLYADRLVIRYRFTVGDTRTILLSDITLWKETRNAFGIKSKLELQCGEEKFTIRRGAFRNYRELKALLTTHLAGDEEAQKREDKEQFNFLIVFWIVIVALECVYYYYKGHWY